MLVWNLRDKQCIAKLKCKDVPISFLNIPEKYLLLETKDGFIYKYFLPDINKGYRYTKMYSEVLQDEIKSKHFTSCSDGLIFLDYDWLIKMRVNDEDKSKFIEEKYLEIEPDDDEREELLNNLR